VELPIVIKDLVGKRPKSGSYSVPSFNTVSQIQAALIRDPYHPYTITPC